MKAVNGFTVGMRVKIHPAFDWFMRGAKYRRSHPYAKRLRLWH